MKRSDRLAIAMLSTHAVLFAVVSIAAVAYHDHELAARFAAGPRTKGTIERIYRHGKESFWADVSYHNVVNGRDVQCRSPVNAGRCAEGLVVGSIIEVAPRPGTCAEVASAFDQ